MAGMEIPVKAIREYAENAIDLVIQVSRLSDGRRKVTSICEVVGFNEDMIKLREVFSFKQTGVTSNGEVIGEFMMNKKTPDVYKKITSRGIETLKDIFG